MRGFPMLVMLSCCLAPLTAQKTWKATPGTTTTGEATTGKATPGEATTGKATPRKNTKEKKAADAAARAADSRAMARRLEYQARARKLAKDDVVGHFALAQWCERKGLPRCARWELHEVLRESPDHVGARQLLGQAFHDGRWLPHESAMRAKGLVHVDGKWMRKYDAARYRAKHTRRLTLQHEANLLFARLASPSARTRMKARLDLESLANTEKLPELGKLARRKAAEYDEYYRRTRRRSYTAYSGLMSVNATHSKLTRMDTFTTSLGAGSPVRIQLPQMKTISVSTTVAIPLGFGR